MRIVSGSAFALMALLGASAIAWAQPTTSPAALQSRPPNRADAPAHSNAGRWSDRTLRATAAPWWGPIASALVPGAGQFAMGQQRSVAYLVAEGYLVLQAVSAQRDGNRDRTEYRSLAADVARRQFSAERPIGAWEYYESMGGRFVESGVFDRLPGGVVDPETDPNTFNGERWRVARQTYWLNPNIAPPTASPEYQRALAFYTQQAVSDEFRWSWRDAQLQKDVYQQTIKSANRRYQRAVTMVGLVGANHLASAIDAYVTVRVRRFGGVRVGSLQLDALRTSVQTVGDPSDGRHQILSVLRLVPAPH